MVREEDVMEDNAVRRRIREMITTGALPCEDPPHLWAGHGDGKRCAGCAERITSGDIEYEAALTSGKMILLHRRCYAIWQEECEPGPATEAPASTTG
jgi:hypothetical protein